MSMIVLVLSVPELYSEDFVASSAGEKDLESSTDPKERAPTLTRMHLSQNPFGPGVTGDDISELNMNGTCYNYYHSTDLQSW